MYSEAGVHHAPVVESVFASRRRARADAEQRTDEKIGPRGGPRRGCTMACRPPALAPCPGSSSLWRARPAAASSPPPHHASGTVALAAPPASHGPAASATHASASRGATSFARDALSAPGMPTPHVSRLSSVPGDDPSISCPAAASPQASTAPLAEQTPTRLRPRSRPHHPRPPPNQSAPRAASRSPAARARRSWRPAPFARRRSPPAWLDTKTHPARPPRCGPRPATRGTPPCSTATATPSHGEVSSTLTSASSPTPVARAKAAHRPALPTTPTLMVMTPRLARAPGTAS